MTPIPPPKSGRCQLLASLLRAATLFGGVGPLGVLFAQPAGDPSVMQRAAAPAGPLVARAATDLVLSTTSREEVRQFFRTVYAASEDVPIGWTGNYSLSDPVAAAGTTSPAFQQATLLRFNFFRALAGVPATVKLTPALSAKDQVAALMMSSNNNLLHTGIPTTWTHYSADGADAAAHSNLSLGLNGAAAITALIQDSDGSGSLASAGANANVGHRRWILYPPTVETGVGDVPGNGQLNAAHATWVSSTVPLTRPGVRDGYVAYPPPGYVPYSLVFARWTFSLNGADFSGATVTMTRDGAPISVRLERLNNAGGGDNTLAWVYDSDRQNTFESQGHARPAADVSYTVTIAGVRSAPQTSYTYTVKVFDDDVAGPDATPVAITAGTIPVAGAAATFNVAKPTFAGGFEWRTVTLAPYAKVYNAEAGLGGLTAATTPGLPAVVQSSTVATGSASYRLSHGSPRSTQFLTLPETFFVRTDGTLRFASRLGIATAIEVARVQVSTDDGAKWDEIFTQAGTSTTGTSQPVPVDAAFVTRTVPLSSYVGRTVRVRFAYTIEVSGTAFVPEAANTVGWFLDDIALTGVLTATAAAPVAVASGSTFSYTPAATGPFVLQARAVLFATYPLEWGPLAQFSAATTGDPANPARLVNLSVLTDVASAGDKFTLGYVVGGNGTSGGKPLVIRAAGPSLGELGVGGTLDDPKLETFAGSAKTGENNDWGGSTTISTAMTAVGAFPYSGPASKDSAIAATITTRDNSVLISAANGTATGKVIAEIYDATPGGAYTAATPRLINVSVNKHLGTSLTMGFVVGGSGARNILIRAIGPTLGEFGVPGVVANPRLELFQGSTSIGQNDDWGAVPALTAAFNQVGAFGLPPTSKDAVLLVPLAPGNYSVVVTGKDGTTGVALVEVYEVP